MRVTKSVIVKAPIHEVWPVISDVCRAANLTPNCSNFELLSKQKKGVGTKSRWIHEDYDTIEEIVAWQPLEYYEWRATREGVPVIDGRADVCPTPEGYTIYTVSEDFLDDDHDMLQAEEIIGGEVRNVKELFNKK